VCRLRHSNAAEAEANPGSDHHSRAQQASPEQREAPRHLSSKVRHRSRNMLGLRRESWAGRQVPARADQGKFRRRSATENLGVNDSARRHLQVQVNTDNMAEVRRRDFVSR